MSLVTYQLQGSSAIFQSRPSSWTKGIKLKQHVETLHMAGRTNRSLLLERSCLSVRVPRVRGVKGKSFNISAFKGNVHDEESGRTTIGSKSTKSPVQLPYSHRDSEYTNVESIKAQSISLPHNSEASETIAGSVAVRNLFKKLITMRRTQSPVQTADEILREGPPPREETETQNIGLIAKAGFSYFLGLDATIKIPLLIFIPLYPAINFMYGAEVSKELTPLWVAGPLIVALYVKLFKWMISLYVFSFNQTVYVLKNLPTYCMVIYTYIAHGKLKRDVLAICWQPFVNARNLDYKEASKAKTNELQEWAMEKYLDFIESIWPFYCRTIRFLKRANFI